jgi:gamma-glutamyl:cysteine ligase YbdK (ATP-grasp superfamily)
MSDVYTLGVEEEYQLVDPHSRELCGKASKLLAAANTVRHPDRVQSELHRCQIEIATNVCHSLDEVRAELVRSRQLVIQTAQEKQVAVVAAGTHPFSRWQNQPLTDKPRYGLSGHLIDIPKSLAVDAETCISSVLAYLRPALEAEGDWPLVSAAVNTILKHGNGAQRQRRWWSQMGEWPYMVDRLIRETTVS